jgi:hypothetical protein
MLAVFGCFIGSPSPRKSLVFYLNPLLVIECYRSLYSSSLDFENAIKVSESGLELVSRFQIDYGFLLTSVGRSGSFYFYITDPFIIACQGR